MKLLLSSKGLNTPRIQYEFKNLITKPIEEVKAIILFIDPNIPLHDKQAYIDEDRQRLITLGVSPENVQSYDLGFESPSTLMGVDVVVILGGNAYRHMSQIRSLGLDAEIRIFIEGEGIYVGRSAGAIIMGPDVDIAGWSQFSNDIGLEDTSGLGFVDFTAVAHIDTRKNPEKVLDYHVKTGKKMICMTDEQGIVVIDDMYKII